MENKICIIGAYFGQFPPYFPLWLKSCEKNPTVDFALFTDQPPVAHPDNVRWIPMTLQEMKQLAEEGLGLQVCLDRPYKCCDFKAVYGVVFQKYISQYDYWGCCDFDLIFGDLQGMFDRHGLYQYDRFLGLGHLSLTRNTPEVNERYRCEGAVTDYVETFTKAPITVFDELPGMTAIYLKNNFPIFLKRIFVDVSIIYHRYRIAEAYPHDVRPKNYPKQIFYWEDGKTYRAYFEKGILHKEEYLYVHFKQRPKYPMTFDPDQVRSFYITNRGFIEKTGEVTPKIVRALNPYPGKLYECMELFIWNARRAIQKVKRMGRKK